MNYLMDCSEQNKYTDIESKLLNGKHKDNPEFSIIIPTYKRDVLLKETLESALGQRGFDNYEILIIDNDSSVPDEDSLTYKLIREIDSEKIIYYKNKENIGIYGNTLRGAELAKGEYVILLNDDDIISPDYIATMKKFIIKYNYYGIIGCMPFEFYKSGFKLPELPEKVHAFKVSEIEFFFGCSVTSPGFMYPKKILYEIYNAHEELLMGDQIIQYKGLKKYDLIFVSFPLAAYRVHDNETKKDDILSNMIYNMCMFRNQTANDNLFLKWFMKFFRNEYYNYYINSSLDFWKKRGLRKAIAERLDLEIVASINIKQIFVNVIIEFVHEHYSLKRKKFSDYVFRREFD